MTAELFMKEKERSVAPPLLLGLLAIMRVGSLKERSVIW